MNVYHVDGEGLGKFQYLTHSVVVGFLSLSLREVL